MLCRCVYRGGIYCARYACVEEVYVAQVCGGSYVAQTCMHMGVVYVVQLRMGLVYVVQVCTHMWTVYVVQMCMGVVYVVQVCMHMGAVYVTQVCIWGRCVLFRCVCGGDVCCAGVYVWKWCMMLRWGGSYVAQVCMHKEGSIHCSGVYGGGVCCSAVCGSYACFTSCSPVSTLVGRKSLSTQLCNTSSFSFETGASLNLETDWYQQHRNPHLVSTLRITRTAEREMAGL